MRIFIEHSYAQHIDKIKEGLDDAIERYPDFNGLDYTIEPDEFTWIDCEDELKGTSLLILVRSIIDEENGLKYEE